MKRLISIFFAIIIFSSAISRAETIRHDFNALNGASKIAYSGGNTVGTVNSDTTYTCTGTNAKFNANEGLICICLPQSGNQVVVSPAISDLDSIRFTYNPTNAYKTIQVYTSTDNSTWTEQTVLQFSKGVSTVKLPEKGDYYVKFRNPSGSNAFYIREIDYIFQPSSGCNCLRVVSE